MMDKANTILACFIGYIFLCASSGWNRMVTAVLSIALLYSCCATLNRHTNREEK